MGYRPTIAQAEALEFSSILEDAPYVVGTENKMARYTSMYSLKCASCQSQNCPRTEMPSKLEKTTKKE